MLSLSPADRERFGFDEQFEDLWWRVEVVGWCVMALLVAGGALGLFGRGPLARARTAPAPLTVEYDRVVRYATPTRLTVSVPHVQPETRVFISRSLLDQVAMQSVEPPAMGSQPRSDGAVLIFAPGAGGTITLVAQPAMIGVVSHTVSTGGAASVEFTQLVLP
jgi:hypothetical protein